MNKLKVTLDWKIGSAYEIHIGEKYRTEWG